MADELESNTFKDAITDAIREKIAESEQAPTSLQVSLYPQSIAGAAIRKLLVDIAVFYFSNAVIAQSEWDPGCGEFFRDLAIRMAEFTQCGMQGRRMTLTETCEYHEHSKEEACYKTMFG